MSRYHDDRDSEIYRRPRRDRDYEELEVDIKRSRQPDSRRAETLVRERESVVSERRPRQPDFLREDYGKSSAGQLVVREERREEDTYSRAPRRRSLETIRSRAQTEKSGREDRLPYPRDQRSEDGNEQDEEVVYRQRTRSRARSRQPPRRQRSDEEIDITILREERETRQRPSPPQSEAPVEEIRFRRGGGDRPPPPRVVEETKIDIRERERATPPPRSVIEREEIDIRERRTPAPPPPRSVSDRDKFEFEFREQRSPPGRGRDNFKEKIRIRERSSQSRHRSASRGAVVARKEEEWIVRRPRTPPPRDWEKEEIIIRRKERSPSPEPEPEPPREPTPEAPPPPPPEPIYRPPIIQEVITHHRHIDHGFERARSPTPPPAPKAPSPPPPPPKEKEENLEIEIRRKGRRNGKAYEEDYIIEQDWTEREQSQPSREKDKKRSVSVSTRRRSPSPAPTRRRYDDEDDDEISAEADFYMRKIASRAYPGEAYNGATKDWALVDVPPGTEKVRMDGVGGGRQEITWQRYNGERRGRFVSGDRAYEAEFGNGYSSPPPQLPPAPAPPRETTREIKEEIRITETRGEKEKPRKRDKMWTEVTKDLVIKEAIDEQGYEYEETDEFFYIIEYLRYEDVLRLVEITEDIKKERRERIREIQWEREEAERVPKMILPPPPIPPLPRSKYDERIYERDYVYDRDVRRYR